MGLTFTTPRSGARALLTAPARSPQDLFFKTTLLVIKFRISEYGVPMVHDLGVFKTVFISPLPYSFR